MKTRILSKILTALLLTTIITACNKEDIRYESNWQHQPDRPWAGPEFWANRLQDWKLEDGQLKCVNSNLALRTVHLLTHQVNEEHGEIQINLEISLNPEAKRIGQDGWAGMLIGAGENLIDYRAGALIQHSPGKAGGIVVAVNELGQVVFLDNTMNREHIGAMQAIPESEYPDSLILQIQIYPNEDSLYTITANAIDPLTRKSISHNNLTGIPQSRISGNIAIASNHIEKGFDAYNYCFKRLNIKGNNISYDPQHRFGPFMGVQHTLSKNILKLTAQLPPISQDDDSYVRLWHRPTGNLTWTEVDSMPVRMDAYIAAFRIEEWNSRQDHDYRLAYRLNDEKGRKRTFYYTGMIKADPGDKPELRAAALSCISHMDGNINGSNCNYPERLWFPHTEFVNSLSAQKADILFFTGDQVYEGRPTPPDYSSLENTSLDYLYKWYIFLWSTGELMRNTPTICIPDDHDVYHGNLWGNGGTVAPKYPADSVYPEQYKGIESYWQQDQGGYKLPASVVNMIQATQTSHLPDPYDASLVEQDITVYYTDLNYGRVSFAILEDRKFKSPPSKTLPDAKVVNGFAQKRWVSGRSLDNPEAQLLGERQLAFLDDWTSDWYQADMKATISQTIFANVSTYPDTFQTDAGALSLKNPPPGQIPEGYRIAKDMDSNGWPQSGRNAALKTIRKGFAAMIGGDQHLGSLVHMGTDTWDDAGYSFCVPAIGNLWPRRWFPPEPGRDHIEGMPLYTGKYYDGFGNKINVWAVANPYSSGEKQNNLYDRAVGYGIIKFNKDSGSICFECWQRNADPDEPETGMYPGWPKTISMLDNYSRAVRSWLPPYEVSGLENKPVFQVINEENGEIIYTLRSPEMTYQPGVFDYRGSYTVIISDPDTGLSQTFENVSARYTKPEEIIQVKF